MAVLLLDLKEKKTFLKLSIVKGPNGRSMIPAVNKQQATSNKQQATICNIIPAQVGVGAA